MYVYVYVCCVYTQLSNTLDIFLHHKSEPDRTVELCRGAVHTESSEMWDKDVAGKKSCIEISPCTGARGRERQMNMIKGERAEKWFTCVWTSFYPVVVRTAFTNPLNVFTVKLELKPRLHLYKKKVERRLVFPSEMVKIDFVRYTFWNTCLWSICVLWNYRNITKTKTIWSCDDYIINITKQVNIITLPLYWVAPPLLPHLLVCFFFV